MRRVKCSQFYFDKNQNGQEPETNIPMYATFNIFLVAIAASALPVEVLSFAPGVSKAGAGTANQIVVHHRFRFPAALFGKASPTQSTTESIASNIMDGLVELDSLTMRVVVDNEVDSMSSGICNVEGFDYTSDQNNVRRRQGYSGANDICSASHGLSLLLTAKHEGITQTLLFDAGADPELWKTNAAKLQINQADIDAVVLSHYHYDHSGGLRGAIPAITLARGEKLDSLSQVLADIHPSGIVSRGRPSVEVLADIHSSGIVSRGETSTFVEGDVLVHKPDNPTAKELRELGATVELHSEEHTLCNGCFYVSGHIPRKTEFEKGLPGHVTLMNGKWVLDTDIADERYLVCKVKDRGLVVFSACSHAGIINVCSDAKQRARGGPLFGVVGGFHLAGGQVQGRISRTVDNLKTLDPAIVLAGHCTGWRAKAQLAMDFEGRFQPLAVGGTYTFHSK